LLVAVALVLVEFHLDLLARDGGARCVVVGRGVARGVVRAFEELGVLDRPLAVLVLVLVPLLVLLLPRCMLRWRDGSVQRRRKARWVLGLRGGTFFLSFFFLSFLSLCFFCRTGQEPSGSASAVQGRALRAARTHHSRLGKLTFFSFLSFFLRSGEGEESDEELPLFFSFERFLSRFPSRRPSLELLLGESRGRLTVMPLRAGALRRQQVCATKLNLRRAQSLRRWGR